MRTPLTRPSANDLSAGLLVALVGIPQCLAYAMLSGIPPMYGLVTAAIPGMIAALFGRSSAVTVGPTNTTGLIILASLTPWAHNPDQLLTAMATLAFFAGVSRLAIVLFKAERIFDFVPEAVMVGFATGAAVIIGIMQFDELVGLPFSNVRNVFDELQLLVQLNWFQIHVPSLILGATALLSVILGKKYAPNWPIPLMVLLGSIGIVWLNGFDLANQWITLGDTTTINDGWPAMANQLPNFQMIRALIIPGFAVAFIGSLELIVTLRNRQEQHLLRDELGSQGFANVAGALLGSFPASTSLTRSVLLDLGGAKSRWAPFIAALTLLPIIFFGAQSIRNIPQPVIAGLLIAIAFTMLKPAAIRQMLRVNSQTRSLFLVTFFSTLILDFHEAILLGSAMGIVLFLFQASHTNLLIYRVPKSGQLAAYQPNACAVLIQISGSLYFAAARQLPQRLSAITNQEIKQLYLDLSHAHHCRVAAIQALSRYTDICTAQGIQLEITGASAELKQLAKSMGIHLPWSQQQLSLTLELSPSYEPI